MLLTSCCGVCLVGSASLLEPGATAAAGCVAAHQSCQFLVHKLLTGIRVRRMVNRVDTQRPQGAGSVDQTRCASKALSHRNKSDPRCCVLDKLRRCKVTVLSASGTGFAAGDGRDTAPQDGGAPNHMLLPETGAKIK